MMYKGKMTDMRSRPIGDDAPPAPARAPAPGPRPVRPEPEVRVAPVPGDVPIPPEWRTLVWPQKRRLAAALSPEVIQTQRDADTIIQRELDRRRSAPAVTQLTPPTPPAAA